MVSKTALFIGYTLASANLALAEPMVLTVGSGGESGTYYPVVQQIAEMCNSPTLTIQHRIGADGKSIGGSDNNLRGILRNEIPAGLAQLDRAFLELQVNPDMPRVQAVLPLHEEALHIIAPSVVTVLLEEGKEANFFGIGGKEPVYGEAENPLQTIADLKGTTVVAWGGSITTAKILSQLGDLNLTIKEVANVEQALAVLSAGEAEAVVAVVGYPAAWVEALPDEQYKLLEVTDSLVEDLESVYGLSGLSYDNLVGGGQQIEALAVDALLFAWEYKSPKFVAALAELQSCVRDNILRFQEEPGMHPAWRRIDPSREMRWENVFVAPATGGTATAPANVGDGG